MLSMIVSRLIVFFFMIPPTTRSTPFPHPELLPSSPSFSPLLRYIYIFIIFFEKCLIRKFKSYLLRYLSLQFHRRKLIILHLYNLFPTNSSLIRTHKIGVLFFIFWNYTLQNLTCIIISSFGQ